MSQVKLKYAQHGKESTAGTLVAATFKWKGDASLKILDTIETPELNVGTGVFGGNVEGAFISQAGSELTLPDSDLSAEGMVWLGNMAIKQVLGAATTFTFSFPTTAANTLQTFTWELATATQEYEFGYGFCPEFSIHGDVGANNGRLLVNAKIRGRKAAASTVTASLGFLANYEPLSIYNATVHFDAAGTAAGTAAATAGYLKAFNVDVKTGANEGRYADGRSTLDFSTIDYSDYEISGRLRCLLSATAVTEIANARAGTSRMVALKCNGTSSRLVQINLPLVYSESPSVGDQDADGMILVEFPFKSGYSRTATVQGPSIVCTASGSTTVT